LQTTNSLEWALSWFPPGRGVFGQSYEHVRVSIQIGVGFPSSSGSKPATNGSQEGVGATSTSSASSIGGPTGPGVMAKPPFRQVKRRAAFVPIRVDLKAVPFDNWAALFKWEERWSTIWPNKKAPHATTKNQRCTEQNSPNPKRS